MISASPLRGRAQNQDPDGGEWARPLRAVLREIPPLRSAVRQTRNAAMAYRRARRVFPRDVCELNAVLSDTPLADRYWVWGGLLLGWAREGRVLPSDMADADFGVRSEDEQLFYEAVPALERAGYRRRWRFRNNEGRITTHSLVRHGAVFDFDFFFPGAGASRHYFCYGKAPEGWLELEGALPDQPLERFRFLGKDWLKPKDHERLLTALYGDWRTPDPAWSYMEDRAVFARRPWNATVYAWR